MGLSISYPPDDYLPAVEDNMGRLFVRSLSFDDMEAADDSPSPLSPAFGHGKLIIEGSLSFKRRESDNIQMQTLLSVRSPRPDRDSCNLSPGTGTACSSRFGPARDRPPDYPVDKSGSPRHQAAALKLQKVYKSFRTRRQLADCAVLVEQRWWKLLDFALLKRNSVSFFDIEKPETAVSKWSRARMRAAKVGKGLSKDEKAQKLALQHWLEAIDPRHRYGHNLHFYYHRWLHCESKQPFFYWLDVGEGKDVNLEEHCPRWKLHKQCIKYLGPKERESYEVIVEDKRLMYKLRHQIVDTTGSAKGTKWIFVLSTCKTLYIGQKQKGMFQHSSFLAGGATSAAGRLVVEDGLLKAVWPHSGHYRPTEQNFQEFMNFLRDRSVDLSDLKLSPSEGEDDGNFSLRGNHSQLDLTELCQEEEDSQAQEAQAAQHHGEDEAETCNDEPTLPSTETSVPATIRKTSSDIRLQGKRPPRLLISSNNRVPLPPAPHSCSRPSPSPGGKEIDPDSAMFGECLDFCKRNLFAEDWYEDHGLDDLAEVPEELILSRINSKRAMHSYQLGKQLSFQWSTGAGPRIGCVRDYPSELQFRALEEVSLSPRDGRPMRFPSPRPGALTPNSIPAGKCGSLTADGDGVSMSLKPRQRSATWTAF
ncbi:IQ domain-containing protein IQM6 [Dichanthelium oligosanthes]|uniref:IQ domain-containing protein IQM6 n=1 Tax=Dichanthelium oligosanthes TaxID=888268 RepID=A0A1E5V4W6_9POAL|nr:IQ domain-containing protein IQM6 [Dichanthelium oligosanthes]